MKNTDTNKKEEFLLQVEYQLKINAWKEKVAQWEKEVEKHREQKL